MPANPLEARCERTLEEISAVSQRIRRSALACSKRNSSNRLGFAAIEKFRCSLETIRISCDAILEAISLENYAIDDRVTDWLLSGEPRICLGKLKEMDEMLKPIGQVRSTRALARPLRPVEDSLNPVIVFFDKCRGLFYFLLTPDVWDRERLLQSSEVTTLGYDTESEYYSATEHDDGESDPLSNVDRTLATRDKNSLHMQQKLDEVLRWLAPLDCTVKHSDILKLRREGTCEWLPNTGAFKKWCAYGRRFLWLRGKAGCGKSVLIASTIEYFKRTVKNEEIVVFFYCDFRNERSMSSTEVMRSVLSQLIRHIRDCGVDPWDLPNKILEQKSEGSLSLNDLDKLCDLVSLAASRFRYEPMVVIDALDECADMEALLRAVVTLLGADIRLLVTSRPHSVIEDHFQGLPSLSYGDVIGELSADICLHVGQELDSHDRLRFANQEMKREIRARLTDRAEGRFRWVQCQLDILNRCSSLPELREALDNLPNELEAAYERILGEIDERKLEGKLARRALVWLVVALEPLRLAQIVDGLSITLSHKVDNEWLRGVLLHALSSLVIHQEGTDVVALSHFSVREYLTSSTALPMYQIVAHEAHAEVAQMCMLLISVFLVAEPSQRKVTPLQSFPMLSYVLSTGFNHLAYVDPDSAITLSALQSLGSDVRHHPSHWESLCELREEYLRWPYPPWPSSRHDFVYYILIAYSSAGLLKLYLSQGDLPKPRVKTTPLVYAADLRKTEHAMALLAYGADVNTPGLVVDDSRYALPLDIAIDLGEDVFVSELLQRGCVLTSELLTTAVCMPWCSTRVLVKLMQTKEFVKWAHEIGDEMLPRSIFNSARPNGGDSKATDENHVTMARILFQVGQDLSANSQFGAELIERAILAAHTSMLEFLLPPDQPPPAQFLLAASTGNTPETVSVVRFLLYKGVDVDIVLAGGDTALHLATRCHWEPRSLELTKMLIDAGCSLDDRNLRGETPLTVAVKRGYCSVVEYLLLRKALLPPDILHNALAHGQSIQMIQLLLRWGANVHATSFHGDTVLHAVLGRKVYTHGDAGEEHDKHEEYTESECLELMKHLIEAGCNTSTCNNHGHTILEVAIERGHSSVVKFLLLSCNTQTSTDVLLRALQRCSPCQTIESICKVANLLSATPNGSSLLRLAIDEYVHFRTPLWVENFTALSRYHHAVDLKILLEVAIERGYISLIEFLLSCGLPLPFDILIFALQHRSTLETVQFLVRKGANVRSTTLDGKTMLHLTIAECVGAKMSHDIVKTLVEAGSDPTACDSEGTTVIEAAIQRGYTSVVELLLQHNARFPPDILLRALWKRSTVQMIQFLIHKGGDVHCVASDGNTVLHLALSEYRFPTCMNLVTTFIGAGCNLAASNSKGRTVLETAIIHEHTSVVELLLQRRVQLPLDILSRALRRRSTVQVIQSLISQGADVHHITPDGDTLLHLASSEYCHPVLQDLVEALIKAGCDLAACDSKGRTVLEAAVVHGHTSVVELLLSHNVAFPPNILSIALERCSSLEMAQCLIQNGANLHSTTLNGDTILHLAITKYPESISLSFITSFIDAGLNPTTRSVVGKSVLKAAIERGYTSVVKYLLRCSSDPLPPDILQFALRCRSNPQMIRRLLTCRTLTYNWDALVQLAHASYPREARQEIVEILDDATYRPRRELEVAQPLINRVFNSRVFRYDETRLS